MSSRKSCHCLSNDGKYSPKEDKEVALKNGGENNLVQRMEKFIPHTISNRRVDLYLILYTRTCLLPLPSRSDHPHWILKQGELGTSGQRLISLNNKTKMIAFFSSLFSSFFVGKTNLNKLRPKLNFGYFLFCIFGYFDFIFLNIDDHFPKWL